MISIIKRGVDLRSHLYDDFDVKEEVLPKAHCVEGACEIGSSADFHVRGPGFESRWRFEL